MSTYKVVQTGANIQFGGLNDGLLMVVYQVLTDSIVNVLPKKPIESGIARQTRKAKTLAIGLFFVIVVECFELTTGLAKCLVVR